MAKAKVTIPARQVARAQMQAWVVNLITLVANAYDGGVVVGAGAQLGSDKVALLPDAMLLLPFENGDGDGVGWPALAISIFDKDTKADARQVLIERYAAAGVHEYWQVQAESGRAWLLQRSADGQLEVIPPDKQGLHFSAVLAELAFPVAWFVDQPDMWHMMDWWGLIDEEE